jgi:hypothetical protein
MSATMLLPTLITCLFPKGGGHSYASYPLGGENGTVVVSMENFGDIKVDPGN